MTWPVTPTTSKRQARTRSCRPCMVRAMIWLALGSVVSGDQGTSDSVCWPTSSRVLAEVAAAMDERDGDHGGGGVGCGAKGVAGEHAETTGVGGQRRRERDLHGEVCDGSVGKVGGYGGESEAGRLMRWFPFLSRVGRCSVERALRQLGCSLWAGNINCMTSGAKSGSSLESRREFTKSFQSR